MALNHEQRQGQVEAEFAARRQAAYESAQRSWQAKAVYDENAYKLQRYMEWKREQERLQQNEQNH